MNQKQTKKIKSQKSRLEQVYSSVLIFTCLLETKSTESRTK